MQSRHYSALVLRRKLEAKPYDHLVELYQPKPRPRQWGGWPPVQIKYLGGRSEPGETPFQTLYREVEQEGGLILVESRVRELVDVPTEDGHIQYFFEADYEGCLGRLITEVGWREENNSFISCPFFMSINVLHSFLSPAHRIPFLKSVMREAAATM